METKKNPAHNLEKRYSLRLFAGLAVAVSVTLVAFEWRTVVTEESEPKGESVEKWSVEFLPTTIREEKIKVEKPKELKKVFINLNNINITDKKVSDEQEKKTFIPLDTTTFTMHVMLDTMKLPEEKGEEEIFKIVEEMPEYPGGETALFTYLATHTKYPEIPKQNGVSGVVYVSFVVNKTGQVTDVAVVRSVDPYLDKEASRVVSSLKNYKPGKQRGKPVSVAFTLPIRFELH